MLQVLCYLLIGNPISLHAGLDSNGILIIFQLDFMPLHVYTRCIEDTSIFIGILTYVINLVV